MKKSSKKRKSKKKSKELEEEDDDDIQTPSMPALFLQNYLSDKKDEAVDISNYFNNYTLQHKKNKNDSKEPIIGVQLSKTAQPFFYIENDIIYDEKDIKDASITDVFGHKCDVGDVSFTNLSINGQKITLPTDLVNSFYPYSIVSYYENQNLEEY